MDQPLRIGIIGDFDRNRPSQMATNEALNHTAKDLSIALDIAWLPTQQLENEFNEDYRDEMDKGALKIVGVDTNGSARIVELLNHRFFVATLFLPQLSSIPRAPHPLIQQSIDRFSV